MGLSSNFEARQNQLANLKPTPNGDKPQRDKLSVCLKEIASLPPETEYLAETNAQAVALSLTRFAKAGSIQHQKEFADRTEGPVTQRLEIVSADVMRGIAALIAEFVPAELQAEASARVPQLIQPA